MKATLLVLSMLLFTLSVNAQEKLSSKNKKAIKAYQEGVDAFAKTEYDAAEKSFREALRLDAKFIESYIMLGTLFEEKRDYKQAIENYKKSIGLDEDFYIGTLVITAGLLRKTGEYQESMEMAKRYLSKKGLKPANIKNAEILIENDEFAIQEMKNPKPFKPENMGVEINCKYPEYSPAMTADESQIIFTRQIPKSEGAKEYQEDFFYSEKDENGNWKPAIGLSRNLNTPLNEGAHTISPDGQILYFTGCNREGGKGSCDIYKSQLHKNSWDYPENIRELNSSAWDSQPSIGPDGRTIYFTSARGGNMDIYVSYLGDDGYWSEPTPLPANINTVRSEMSPFIHPDGKTLYFASDGHQGMGGLDIFYSRKTGDTTWSDPINIGYPINTYNDEGFLFVTASGKKALFASDKLGGQGTLDIYSFELYEQARPTPVTYLKGIVADSKSNNTIPAHFELFEVKTGKLIASSIADERGEFLLCIPTNNEYALNVSMDKYLFYSENISLEGEHGNTDPITKRIDLQPIGMNEVVVLKNIFFDFDKYDLKPESNAELIKLVGLLKNNPKLRIEIGGHTDNVGSKEHNRVLSENRAKAVYSYLVNAGIAASRLSYKGYGDASPIAPNTSDEGRALNRRTEFKVISF